jgi:K+-transporting ATPase KdpF subunit
VRAADEVDDAMSIENIILTIVSLAVLLYLFVALVRPEVF